MTDAPAPVVVQTFYRITVTPSSNPDRGAFYWHVHLHQRVGDVEAATDFIASGTRDGKDYALEDARDAVRRHRAHPPITEDIPYGE